MVYVSTADRTPIAQAVRECFATDQDLLRMWHVEAPADIDTCVARTVTDANEFDASFQFHRAYANGDLAGYWGLERNGSYLNLIFLKPKYRRTEFARQFWDAVKQTAAPTFVTAVYAKNIPAAKFYSKHCAESFHRQFENGEDGIFFKFSNQKEVRV